MWGASTMTRDAESGISHYNTAVIDAPPIRQRVFFWRFRVASCDDIHPFDSRSAVTNTDQLTDNT
jgi:hypothetical protein